MANAWFWKPLGISSVSATNTAVGFSPLYVANDYAGVVWQSNGEAKPFLIVDFGSDAAIDTVALFGLSGFTAAHVTTIAVATSAQGSSFGAGTFTSFVSSVPVLAGVEMPVSGRGVGLYSVSGSIVGRYAKIIFAGLSGAVQISRVAAGRRIQLERNFSFGGAFGVRDLGSVDFSRRGVLLRTRGKKLRTVGLSFSNINKDEVETSTRPLLEQVGNTDPVVLFTDPDPHAQRQNRGYFGPFVGDLGHVQRTAKSFEARANIVSLF